MKKLFPILVLTMLLGACGSDSSNFDVAPEDEPIGLGKMYTLHDQAIAYLTDCTYLKDNYPEGVEHIKQVELTIKWYREDGNGSCANANVDGSIFYNADPQCQWEKNKWKVGILHELAHVAGLTHGDYTKTTSDEYIHFLWELEQCNAYPYGLVIQTPWWE